MRAGDVTAAFMALPQLLAAAIDKLPDDTSQQYASAILSPFGAYSKNARVPRINSPQTVCTANYSSISWTSEGVASVSPMFFANFTTLNTSACVFMPKVNTVGNAPVATTFYATSGEPGFTISVRY